MLKHDRRSISRLLTAAGLAVAVALPATRSLAQAEPAATTTQTGVSAREVLEKATDLLAQDRPVKAKSILTSLSDSGSLSLSDSERDHLYKLLINANRRVKALGPIEASVQGAEDSLDRDDLVNVRRHATAVIDAPKATNEQIGRAKASIAAADARAGVLAGQLADRLASAEQELDAGRGDQARAILAEVSRWGVTADDATQARMDLAKGRVMNATAASAGMLQPGVIKKREPDPAPAVAPATQPAEQPVAQPAATPAAQPTEPVAQPAATPAAQPEAAPAQPPQDDIVAQARRFEAASIIAEADAAYDASLLKDAAAKYDRVLNVFGDVISAEQKAHASQRLAEARTRMNVNPGQNGEPLTGALRDTQVAHDQVLAEFNNDVEQATKALASGDPKRARDLAANANLRINSGKQYLSAGEFETLRKQIDDLRVKIDTDEDRIRREEADKRERDLEAQARLAAIDADKTKEQKIAQAFERARALQSEMKYAEAMQVVENVLFLDPVNPTALLLRDVYQDIILLRRYQGYYNTFRRNVAEHSADNFKAVIPPLYILDYPEDWPSISEMRGESVAFADTEDNRRALASMESKRIPVEFTDTPFESVMGFLQTVSGLSVDVNYPSLEAAGIDRDAQVNMRITNASVRTVLDRVLEQVGADSTSGAAWAVQDGILVVASKEVINRNKSLNIYDIRDLLVEVPDYTQAPEFDLQSVLQSTGQGGRGGGGQSPFRQTGNQQNDRSNRRSLEDRTTDLINIITTNVDQQGWQENGGDVGYIQQLSGNLIITQTPANHREIHGLLKKLRETRAMQINVETRFLLVSQDFFEQVGIDLDVYFNGRNNQIRTARGTIPTTRPSDLFDFGNGGLQRTYPQPPTTGANDNNTPLPNPLSVVGAGQNTLGMAESLLQSDFGLGILSGAPALGVAGQFLDDIQVDFLVKATQADRRTVTLTAPRLTFTNGQTSNIYVATQISFVSDLTPVTSNSAVAFDPQLGVVNEGVRLLVDGVISADRRYVTLNVDASVAKIEGFVNTPVTAAVAGQLLNSATTQSFIQRPTVTVTRVQTTVTVPDQGTILLGGQRLVTESETESGVPVLSKIPIINRFFTNRVMAKEEQTLLILLKPTVLIQNEEEERHFPGLGDSLRFGG